jgi:predicted  nucleic acid-binding Zn-ribbon protein
VSSGQLERLLVVQDHDLALDRLRHRRASLPQRAELEARSAEGARVRVALDGVVQERDTVQAEERRLDDQATTVGTHATDVEQRLYSGTVSSPRELQAMQADMEMLQRQRRELEDRELEVMEQREALDSQINAAESALGALDADVTRLRAEIEAAEREIDAEIVTEQAARDTATEGIDAGVLRDYEARRARNRGAGAARLVGTTCQACHLSIPSTEAERIRRGVGEVVAYCDNCGAILVP